MLKTAKLDVYDFKDKDGFNWDDIAPSNEAWSFDTYKEALDHPLAIAGFNRDWEAMQASDTFILSNPCGRSAHLELGWAVGQGKKTAIFMPKQDGNNDLMYRMVDLVTDDMMELLQWLGVED